MKKADIAIDTFNNNRNCAQSVVGAYAEQYNLDKDTLYQMATTSPPSESVLHGIYGSGIRSAEPNRADGRLHG